GLAVAVWRYQAPFSYEPVGPRAYALLCVALMGAGLAWLFARPTTLRPAPPPKTPGPALRRHVVAGLGRVRV
ncbi:tripartite tricarboxylate transporter TctB family protein, partial [Pseudomonas aeruginosa]